MEKKSQISAYEKEFPGWKIGKFLGRGSGGNTVVYEIYRENYDLSEHDALKVAKIMDDEIGMRKMTDEYREKYKSQRDEKKEKAMNEVRLMNMMQNCSNIVSYQDWKIAEIEEEDYTTVELLIRMHIYTDLDTIFKTHGVYRLGIDGVPRYSLVQTTIYAFTDSQLLVYSGNMDIATGAVYKESADEIFYKDINSIAREEVMKKIKIGIFKKRYYTVKYVTFDVCGIQKRVSFDSRITPNAEASLTGMESYIREKKF